MRSVPQHDSGAAYKVGVPEVKSDLDCDEGSIKQPKRPRVAQADQSSSPTEPAFTVEHCGTMWAVGPSEAVSLLEGAPSTSAARQAAAGAGGAAAAPDDASAGAAATAAPALAAPSGAAKATAAPDTAARATKMHVKMEVS
jgi:hypothetical protein